jgi:hypothetical protein
LLLAGAALASTDGFVDIWSAAGALFLVAVALVILATALFARLELSRDGFSEWRLFAQQARWRDIDDLRPERGVYGLRSITFRRRPGSDQRPTPLRLISARDSVGVRYGLDAVEQCALMERWRRNAIDRVAP